MRTGNKLKHYFELYENIFFGLQPKRLLEIGVQTGESLKYWHSLFSDCMVYGIDIDDQCLNYADKKTKIIICEQNDEMVLKSLPAFDIIIDDGSHIMSDQQASFEILFPRLNSGGWYVIEDLHTSYWPHFIDCEPTVNYLKELVDMVNADYAFSQGRHGSFYPQKNSLKIKSILFFSSIVFIQKI